MKKLSFLVVLMFLMMSISSVFAKDLPKVAILATGGTIAGSTNAGGVATSGYKAGVLTVDTLINAVPEIKNLAQISGQQVVNIDSSNMSKEIWLQLAKTVNELLAGDIDGIVITHGTDTMEETAYFLNLVVKSDKPVVLVGAMRPSTAISADGPKNLYNAVALAATPEAKGKGVMVAMDDMIYGGRDVTKTNTTRTSTFKAPNSGALGIITDGMATFYVNQAKPHTTATEFDVMDLKALPKVDILYSYASDGSGPAARALVKDGAKGIVVAGSGAGSINKNQGDVLKELIKSDKLVVVRSSHTGSGLVPLSAEGPFLTGDDLNPQKARILLMLALTKTTDPKAIQAMFNKY